MVVAGTAFRVGASLQHQTPTEAADSVHCGGRTVCFCVGQEHTKEANIEFVCISDSYSDFRDSCDQRLLLGNKSDHGKGQTFKKKGKIKKK